MRMARARRRMVPGVTAAVHVMRHVRVPHANVGNVTHAACPPVPFCRRCERRRPPETVVGRRKRSA